MLSTERLHQTLLALYIYIPVADPEGGAQGIVPPSLPALERDLRVMPTSN